MNSLRRRRLVTLTALITFTSLCTFPGPAVAATVAVPIGTIVTAAFTEVVDAAVFTEGQVIGLEVVDPVVIDGVTVIEAGASVRGEVTAAQKSGAVGKPARIQVSLRTVTAVDGSQIALTATKTIEGENKQTSSLVITLLCCILGLLQKGGNAQIPAGASVQATTVAAANVDVP